MSRESMSGRPADLVAWLLNHDGDATTATLELLREFQRGFDLSNLRRLLRSRRPEAVAAGIWIASELGPEARPLCDDVASLVFHTSSRVRFFALDCLASCLTPSNAKFLAKALDRIEDSDTGVRWKMLVVLAGLSDSVIVATRREAAQGVAQMSHVRGLDLLLRGSAEDAKERIHHALDSGDSVLRAYGAVAAARIAAVNMQPLRCVMGSEDQTLARFAQDMAERASLASEQ